MRALPFVFVALLPTAACDAPFTPPPPTSGPPPGGAVTIALRPDSAHLFVSDSLLLTASVRDQQGQLLVTPVTWSVDDSTVVSVAPTGLAIAVGAGRAVVHATSAGLTDSTPIVVAPVRYASVAAGAAHTCAVGTNGRAYCWGRDGEGQLGVSPQVLEDPAPRPIAAGAGFIVLAAGHSHTCGTGTDQEVRCWGANEVGQLGLGTTGSPGLPAAVPSLYALTGVSAGGDHVCATTSTQQVVCWGRNSSGELGVGDTAVRPTPTLVGEGLTVAAVAVGAAHTCGLTPQGSAFCWGADQWGQLGDSARMERSGPDSVHGGGFDLVAAGGNHTCARSGDTSYCWGSNQRGESGTGLPDSALLVPTPVTGGLAFTALTLGSDFTCGLTAGGAAYCWGANDEGQLGDGTQTDRPAPTAVSGGLAFQVLAAGDQHVCGVTTDGAIYCWGDGTSGQLGLAVPPPLKTVPTRVPFPN